MSGCGARVRDRVERRGGVGCASEQAGRDHSGLAVNTCVERTGSAAAPSKQMRCEGREIQGVLATEGMASATMHTQRRLQQQQQAPAVGSRGVGVGVVGALRQVKLAMCGTVA